MGFKSFIVQHGVTILTGVSCVGVISTAILAVHDGVKAEKLLEDSNYIHKENKIEDLKEEAKITWKAFIPTAVSASLTIGSIILSRRITVRQIAALGAAVGSSGYLLSEYKESIKDLFGQECYEEVVRDVARKHKEGIQTAQISCINGQGGFYNVQDEINVGQDLFFDEFSQTWFRSSKEAVRQAFYHFNRNYAIGGCIEMAQLYEFLGIQPNGGSWYENYGYGWSFREQDINWIDFELVDAVDEESGEAYTVIAYVFMPEQLDISDVPATDSELADIDYELSYATV